MIEWLSELQPWHWMVLCLVLLGLEAMGTGGFLLGAAAAACTVAAVRWLFVDVVWSSQLIIFAIATVVYSVAYWRIFRNYNELTEQPLLNDRASQLIGRRWALTDTLPEGESKVQIGDTLWRVNSDVSIPAGTMVEVVAAQDMVLKIDEVLSAGAAE